MSATRRARKEPWKVAHEFNTDAEFKQEFKEDRAALGVVGALIMTMALSALQVEPGESLLALWDRVRAAGARCNRTFAAIVERVQQILYSEALTNSNTVARMAYDFLTEVSDKYTDAAALEMRAQGVRLNQRGTIFEL